MALMNVSFTDIPAIPGLDARETAATVWAALILGYVALKSSGFRDSLLSTDTPAITGRCPTTLDQASAWTRSAARDPGIAQAFRY
jgi:hypothetical protein